MDDRDEYVNINQSPENANPVDKIEDDKLEENDKKFFSKYNPKNVSAVVFAMKVLVQMSSRAL